jgi:threonine dehydrogenase-like Zn-dependent dehydrogenase
MLAGRRLTIVLIREVEVLRPLARDENRLLDFAASLRRMIPPGSRWWSLPGWPPVSVAVVGAGAFGAAAAAWATSAKLEARAIPATSNHRQSVLEEFM